LRHLEELGLMPGAQIEVTSHSPFDNNLSVSVGGHPVFVVGLAITSKIFVEIL
jgi:Fe2+ transport system protein FeoA